MSRKRHPYTGQVEHFDEPPQGEPQHPLAEQVESIKKILIRVEEAIDKTNEILGARL